MLTLYYKPTCPYSQLVLGEAEELGVQFRLKDISSDETFAEELIAAGGKRQVPYLVDDEQNVSMYESRDIVEYLKEHYPHGSSAGAGSFSGLKIHRSDDTCESCQ